MNRLVAVVFGGSIAAACCYLYLTSKPSKGKRCSGLCGLYNLGNTCYANALIQGLSSVRPMVAWFRRLHCSDDEATFVSQLGKLMIKLDEERGETLSAHGVSDALIAHGWTIGVGVEQDLHELLNVFLSTWEEELSLALSRRLTTSLLDVTELQHQLPDRGVLAFQRCRDEVRMYHDVHAPCTGITATLLQCADLTCAYKKVRHDNFSVIPLSIPKSLRGMQLRVEVLMRDYFRIEVIRGATCDICETKVTRGAGLIKKLGFAKLPSVLLIRIERVGMLPSGALYKISDRVDFSEYLDVRDFCFYRSKEADYAKSSDSSSSSSAEPPSMEGEEKRMEGSERTKSACIVGGSEGGQKTKQITSFPRPFNATERNGAMSGDALSPNGCEDGLEYRYQLRAVSEHRGQAETGHFVTYRRGLPPTSNTWLLTNDSQVTRVPFSQVARAEAYMLYYEKVIA